MDRINGAGHLDHMFVHEDAENNQAPTEITAEWLNNVQEELVAIATDEGVDSLQPGNKKQAIQKIKELIAEAVANIKNLPVGTIIAITGDFDPALFDDYLLVPTAPTNLNRVAYPELFARWGTKYGPGDGVSTFGMYHLPADYALVQASGGNSGTVTVGEVIAHTHSGAVLLGASSGQAASSSPNYINHTNTGSTGGPANLAAGSRVIFLVKYK